MVVPVVFVVAEELILHVVGVDIAAMFAYGTHLLPSHLGLVVLVHASLYIRYRAGNVEAYPVLYEVLLALSFLVEGHDAVGVHAVGHVIVDPCQGIAWVGSLERLDSLHAAVLVDVDVGDGCQSLVPIGLCRCVEREGVLQLAHRGGLSLQVVHFCRTAVGGVEVDGDVVHRDVDAVAYCVGMEYQSVCTVGFNVEDVDIVLVGFQRDIGDELLVASDGCRSSVGEHQLQALEVHVLVEALEGDAIVVACLQLHGQRDEVVVVEGCHSASLGVVHTVAHQVERAVHEGPCLTVVVGIDDRPCIKVGLSVEGLGEGDDIFCTSRHEVGRGTLAGLVAVACCHLVVVAVACCRHRLAEGRLLQVVGHHHLVGIAHHLIVEVGIVDRSAVDGGRRGIPCQHDVPAVVGIDGQIEHCCRHILTYEGVQTAHRTCTGIVGDAYLSHVGTL